MGLKKLVCITSLAFITACCPATIKKGEQQLSLKQVVQEIRDKDIIYFGEIHDSKQVHKVQIELLKKLYNHNKDFSVAMEMVQKGYQPALDEYLKKPSMSEEELKTKLSWEKTWGHDFKLYKPIFKFAKEKELGLVALNAPKRIVQKVARQGLSSLVEEDFEYVPRDVYLDEEEYKNLLGTLKKFHSNTSGEDDSSFYRRMYEAQSLWNETMAEAIIDYLIKNKDKHLLVIAGDRHVGEKPGIPGRVEMRVKKENLELKTSIISLTKGDYIISVKK